MKLTLLIVLLFAFNIMKMDTVFPLKFVTFFYIIVNVSVYLNVLCLFGGNQN